MIQDVYVSDLHLGAPNSLLSNVTDTGVVPGTPSPVLHALGGALRSLMAQQEDPPRLVLGGDIFELALTPTHCAFDTFGDFIRVMFDDPVFSPELHYVAGNHDHHLWELARQHQYTEYIDGFDRDAPLRNDWHVTHLLPENDRFPHGDVTVTAAARRACPTAGITVRHTYPNLGFVGEVGTVVYHHGHYTERIYRAVEWLDQIFEPSRPEAQRAWHIEADNYAWVDFLWSTLGRSGDAGGDVGALYEMLQSEAAIEAVVDRVLDTIIVRDKPTWRRRIGNWMLRLGTKLAVHEGLRLERHRGGSAPLSKDAERGMHDYLRVAVATQLADETGHPDHPLTFVFGHTHKPFASQIDVDGIDHPVDVFNTGGWVIDSVEPAPLQGASLVVGDRHGHVAAIEVYQQAQGHNLSVTSVSPQAAGFVGEIERRIETHRPVWDVLESTIADEIMQRRRQLARRIVVDTNRVKGIEPKIAPSASERRP